MNMKKKIAAGIMAAVCLAQSVIAYADPAYYVTMKGWRSNLVNVDGEHLSLGTFNDLCEKQSPRAAEQIQLCRERRFGSGISGVLGIISGYMGYNTYLKSRDTAGNDTRVQRETEGLMYLFLSAVLFINSHTSALAAQDAQVKAVEYFNQDTGRVRVSLRTDQSLLGLTLSKKF